MNSNSSNLNGITVRPAAEGDFEALRALCDGRLGDGYLSKDDYLDRIKYPSLNLVAESEEGELAGFVSMTPEGAESLGKAVQLDPEKILRDAKGRPCIHFRTAISSENFEHRGIVRMLLGRILDSAEREGYGLILSPVWEYDGKAPAAKFHDDFGFVSLGRREDLWADQQGYTCILCKGPCHCSAILYELVFD